MSVPNTPQAGVLFNVGPSNQWPDIAHAKLIFKVPIFFNTFRVANPSGTPTAAAAVHGWRRHTQATTPGDRWPGDQWLDPAQENHEIWKCMKAKFEYINLTSKWEDQLPNFMEFLHLKKKEPKQNTTKLHLLLGQLIQLGPLGLIMCGWWDLRSQNGVEKVEKVPNNNKMASWMRWLKESLIRSRALSYQPRQLDVFSDPHTPAVSWMVRKESNCARLACHDQ